MIGRIHSWTNRGFGFIAVKFNDLYFLHPSNIVEFPEGFINPQVGWECEFDAAPARPTGKHPVAVNVKILNDQATASRQAAQAADVVVIKDGVVIKNRTGAKIIIDSKETR